MCTRQIGKPIPFVSRVYHREPLGLPPIKSNLVVNIEKRQPPSYVEYRNRQIIKKIQSLKKQEKIFLNEEENITKKKHEKYRDYTIKNNNNINEIREELYGENPNNHIDNI